jgi:hypothetical protein
MTKASWRLMTTGFVAAGVLTVSLPAFQGAKPDPVVGTWTLNVAKSKFEPGPGAKSGTVTFMSAGEGMHVVAEIVGPDSTMKTDYTANYDGKDYPIKGATGVDMVSLKRIDASSSERTDKMGGKVVGKWTRKVSADGKTMTVTYDGTDAKGQTVHNLLVFDRKS